MRVKVSYTTDLENIPYECWRLIDYKIHDASELGRTLKELDKLLLSHNKGDTNFNFAKAKQQIEKARSILSDYDQCISDINTILSDWSDFCLQPEQQQVTLDKQQKQDEQDF